MNDRTYDVVVVGGGAAGLSAALVLAQARRDVLVIDAGAPRNERAEHMHGFLTREGCAPGELLAIGRAEVKDCGGTIRDGTVTRLARRDPSGFTVGLDDGHQVAARRVLVATGVRDELPEIPGLRERWARDVLHCPYCHGYDVQDLPIGVLGGSPDAVHFAQMVRQWVADVVFFALPGILTDAERAQLLARDIGIVETPVTRVVVEDDRLCGIELEDGRTIPRRAVFVPPHCLANSDLLAGLGCDLDEAGWVRTGPTGETSVPGVWAAGNVADSRAQVVMAAGEGAAAGIAINADLVDDDIAQAVRDRQAALRR